MTQTKYKITPLKYAIHIEKDSPVFGGNDPVTHVSVDDEAAGIFFVITQDDQEIKLDVEELEKLYEASRILLIAHGVTK